MDNLDNKFLENGKDYLSRLNGIFTEKIFQEINKLSKEILKVWESGNNIFIFGNGGSSANAQHIANDFLYGVGVSKNDNHPNSKGLRIEALTANSNVITCLGNDIGYENIFSYQLEVKAIRGDLVIALSGSGNSPNIVNALKFSYKKNIQSCAILGFQGGRAKEYSNINIHFPIDDMEIAEDTQMIVFNIIKQWLIKNRENKKNGNIRRLH